MDSTATNSSVLVPKRALGRSLTDFSADGLLSAEKKLLDAAARGEKCEIDSSLPESAREENRVRSAFLRFLLVGGDGGTPVHEKGVQLTGAFIEGDIDLENAEKAYSLQLSRCRIVGTLIGTNAGLAGVDLRGSHIRGISCDGAHIRGGVFLSGGFDAAGAVRFVGAEIDGQLNCDGGRFKNASGDALSCDGAHIRGEVFMSGGFDAEGEVRFIGTEIDGQLNCDGGRFKNASGDALSCDNAHIGGGVFLSGGFYAEGEVRFIGADIAGSFACTGGSFQNARPGPRIRIDQPLVAASALSLVSAKIQQILYLGPALEPYNQQVTIRGSLDLQGAYARLLVDDPQSWPVSTVKTGDGNELPCVMKLDGFTYERFIGGSPTDAATRRAWLLRGPRDGQGGALRSQPFEQLIKVLREMGYTREARNIGYFKEYCSLRQSFRGWRKWLNPFAWLQWLARWLLLEKALGHGYYPQRMVILAIAAWIGCGLLYTEAANQGIFAPTNPRVYLDIDLKQTCAANSQPAWTSGPCALNKRVPEYTVFDPYIFSLDVILPVVNLRQQNDWQPLHRPLQFSFGGYQGELTPDAVRGVVWAETIFAWVWSLSLSAVATGVIKRI